MENCLDLTIPFVEKATSEGYPIQLFGGVGSAALALTNTEYSSNNREIVTKKRLDIARLRDNGSPKDLDVQVLATDQSSVEAVEEIAEETIGDKLDVNVFGLHEAYELHSMVAHPFTKTPATAAVTDRYVVGDFTGSDYEEYYKAVFPFGVASPQSSLETWHVVSLESPGDTPIPVPHPSMMILNNLTRSIAGMRKKYDQKILAMTDNIISKDSSLIDWMVEGPGKSQVELAGVLRSLGWLGLVRKAPEIKLSSDSDLAISPPSPGSLIDHPAFLMSSAPAPVQRRVIALARLKSTCVVGPVERHFMDQWERYDFERHFRNIVRNK